MKMEIKGVNSLIISFIKRNPLSTNFREADFGPPLSISLYFCGNKKLADQRCGEFLIENQFTLARFQCQSGIILFLCQKVLYCLLLEKNLRTKGRDFFATFPFLKKIKNEYFKHDFKGVSLFALETYLSNVLETATVTDFRLQIFTAFCMTGSISFILLNQMAEFSIAKFIDEYLIDGNLKNIFPREN